MSTDPMVPFSRIVFYCFSGTGNSRKIVDWCSQNTLKHQLETKTVLINSQNSRDVEPPSRKDLLIFISPVHGFNFPPIFINYLLRFPPGKSHVIFMNTRGGMRIGKWVTPGLSGISFFLGAILLMLKGYAIKGMIPFDMPSNWISLHPGLNQQTIQYIQLQNRAKVDRLFPYIMQGKPLFPIFWSLPFDLLIAPIALLYFIAGRFLLAKSFYASSKCNRCNKCVRECPVKAIKIIDGRPFWSVSCESCMHCMGYCPEKAIETAHGMFFLIIFGCSFFLTSVLYPFFESWAFPEVNGLIKFVFENGFFLIMMILGYRLSHFLLQFSWYEKLMRFGSMTSYRFWGRRYRADGSDPTSSHKPI